MEQVAPSQHFYHHERAVVNQHRNNARGLSKLKFPQWCVPSSTAMAVIAVQYDEAEAEPVFRQPQLSCIMKRWAHMDMIAKGVSTLLMHLGASWGLSQEDEQQNR